MQNSLVASKEDFDKDCRKSLTAKMATADYDTIIKLRTLRSSESECPQYQEQFLREQIAEYEELLKDAAAAKSDRARRNIIKSLEKQKANREEWPKDPLAEDKKDSGLVFDELGIDHIIMR